MIRNTFSFLVLLIVLSFIHAISGSVPASAQGTPVNDAKSEAFARISSVSKELRTLSSDFTQERHVSVLKDPLLSTGRFGYRKPGFLYWETTKPAQSGFMVTDGKARRWNKDRKNSQTFDMEKEPIIRTVVEQVFAWTRADFPWLEKRYAVTVAHETPTALRLTPLSPHEKKHISYLVVRFAEDWSQLDCVEIHEKGGDFTRMVFSNTVLNQPLPGDLSD